MKLVGLMYSWPIKVGHIYYMHQVIINIISYKDRVESWSQKEGKTKETVDRHDKGGL